MRFTLDRNESPTDLVGLLLECHERIRRFVGIARKIGEAREVDPGELREAAAAVHRYFAEALPLHVADEEESILPRLRGRDADLDRHLQRMHAEHDAHQPLLHELLDLCARLEADPARLSDVQPRLAHLAADLERELENHLDEEEREIFPAIERLTTDAERDKMVEELHRRRTESAG